MRAILPLGMVAVTMWIGGNVLLSGIQIVKHHADSLAVTMCQVSDTPCQ